MLHKFFILAAIVAAISSVFAGNNANILEPTASSFYRREDVIHVRWSLPQNSKSSKITVLLVEGEADVNKSPNYTRFRYNAGIEVLDYLTGHVDYTIPYDLTLSFPTYRVVIIHHNDPNNWSFSPAFVIKEQKPNPTHAPTSAPTP